MDRYYIYGKIAEELDLAIDNLQKEDVDWLIDRLIRDLEELKEQKE